MSHELVLFEDININETILHAGEVCIKVDELGVVNEWNEKFYIPQSAVVQRMK